MAKLSVIIITKNEAHNIEDCIKSASFANEIIVFDSSSTDNTVTLAKALGASVTVTPDWPGDGPQKNRALTLAKGEWVLCLDADERVTPQLQNEIQSILAHTPYAAFDIPYCSTYLGRKIRHGDWRGESHIRLFKRESAKFTEDIVHCHLKTQGTIGKLKYEIIHHPFQNLSAMLHKLNDYSTQSAKRLYQKGRKASLLTALSRGAWTFLRGYFLKAGFLDGAEGFILAISNAQGTYYRYLKLRYLWQNQTLSH